MSELVAWIKEHVRKTQIKEFIKAHTGLTPPAFIAVVALAAAGTALTVSAVSSLLVPPKKNDGEIDRMLDNVMDSSYSNNEREVAPIATIVESPKEEEEEETEEVEVEAPTEEVKAPAEEVEAPTEEIEAPTEEVEAPAKEETTETTEPTETDGEDNSTSDYVSIDNTSTD